MLQYHLLITSSSCLRNLELSGLQINQQQHTRISICCLSSMLLINIIGLYYLTINMQQKGYEDVLASDIENQFLSSEQMEYETCAFCNRKFFRGKLAFHLKLCNQDNPMVKSNTNSPRHKKNALSAANSYERCSKCQTRIPSYLIKKHEQNCQMSKRSTQKTSKPSFRQTKISSQIANESLFPKIHRVKNNDPPNKFQKKVTFFSSDVKIREDLRCFRKAEEVQKVTCDNCGRKFSEAASLRHIPVCASLILKHRKQGISKPKSRNYMNPSMKIQSAKIDKIGITRQMNSKSHLIENSQQLTTNFGHFKSMIRDQKKYMAIKLEDSELPTGQQPNFVQKAKQVDTPQLSNQRTQKNDHQSVIGKPQMNDQPQVQDVEAQKKNVQREVEDLKI